jgi:integrase
VNALTAAPNVDREAQLIVLLGGDDGLRCGEMIALEWNDVDLQQRQICIRRSDWNGQITIPTGGRLRHVPLTSRLSAALRQIRHLRSRRVLCHEDGTPFTRQQIQYRVKKAALLANVREGVHVLRHTFCSQLAMRGVPARAIQELAGHTELATTQRYMHSIAAVIEAAIRLLESPGVLLGRGEEREVGAAEVGKANV